MIENQSGSYPIKRNYRTDELCYKFSILILISSIFLYFFIIFSGYQFSFLFPESENGYRCGINNNLFSNNFPDYSLKKYLINNKSQINCITYCNYSKFFFYCIPNKNFIKDQNFKYIFDFLKYWKISLIIFIFLIIFSLPLYYLFFKIISTIILSIFYLFIGIISFGFFWSLKNFEYILFLNLLIFLILLLIILNYLKNKLNLIYPIFSIGISFLFKSSTSFLSFLLIIFIGFFTILLNLIGYFFIKGIGEPEIIKNKLIINQHNSFFFTIIFIFLLFQWIYQIFLTWIRISLSFIIISIFYKKKKIPNLKKSLKIIFKYHLGTIFFGSGIVFIFETFTSILISIQTLLSKSKSTFIKFLFQCFISIFYCILKIAGEINKISFVITSMKGFSFWDSCKESTIFLKNEIIFNLKILIHEILLIIKFFLIFIIFLIIYFFFSKLNLFNKLIPLFFIPFISYLILNSFNNLIETIIDTVLYCVYEDSQQKNEFIPKNLLPLSELLNSKNILKP